MKQVFLPLTAFAVGLLMILPQSLADSGPECAASEGTTPRKIFYSYSTEDQTPANSLNRIAGEIDTGFATPEQAYKSDHHTKAGAVQRSDAYTKRADDSAKS